MQRSINCVQVQGTLTSKIPRPQPSSPPTMRRECVCVCVCRQRRIKKVQSLIMVLRGSLKGLQRSLVGEPLYPFPYWNALRRTLGQASPEWHLESSMGYSRYSHVETLGQTDSTAWTFNRFVQDGDGFIGMRSLWHFAKEVLKCWTASHLTSKFSFHLVSSKTGRNIYPNVTLSMKKCFWIMER